MLKHIKLLVYRIMHDKVFLTLYLVLIPVVMGIAVYLTNNISYSMNIALVGEIEVVENEHITYSYLEEVPKTSQIVLSQYDAIVEANGNELNIISTKGESFDQAVPFIISGQVDPMQTEDTARGAATNIIGFLMMVITLLGVQLYSNYYFYERGSIHKRILSTSMNCTQYMLSHFIVVLTFLCIPALIVIQGALLLFDISLAISFWEFTGVLFLLCFFAASFGLWINSLSKSMEEGMMFGNMYAIGASIVAGAFVPITENEIFNNIVQLLPQKQIMTLLSALENNSNLPITGLIYVVIISFFLIVIAIYVEKRKLPNR